MFRAVSVFPMIIFGVIFFTGLMNAINPRILWKHFESWKAKEEPSAAYFMMRRISGIVAMLIVSAMFIYPYLMSRM